jgi:hypothetical protein
MEPLLLAALTIETLLLLVCVLELRDTRRKLLGDDLAPMESSDTKVIVPQESKLRTFMKEFSSLNVDSNFDKAKKLSDFIAMITRLGFIFFISAYFFKKFMTAASLIEKFLLFIPFLMPLILSIYFATRINSVIQSYFINMLPDEVGSQFTKYVLYACYIFLVLSLGYALFDVGFFVANSTRF